MAKTQGLTLYHIPQSRSLTALWMLEELGLPYTIEKLDVTAGEQRGEAYRRINPSGKVPALRDGPMVVTERGAICMHLADRYAPGRLAPTVIDADRPAYLAWMFYGAGVVEPILTLTYLKVDTDGVSPGSLAWGNRDTAISVLTNAVVHSEFLLGKRFTAADVMIGSMLRWGLAAGVLSREGPIAAYVERLTARPALARAVAADGTR
ncbi:MAG: glutathione S-transferase family protein [Alphaproteobacteria bacterium]